MTDMQILSIKCQHGNEVACPSRPEMDCILCAEEVAKEYYSGVGSDASGCIGE